MKIDVSLGLDLDPRERARAAQSAGVDGVWAGEVRHDPLTSLMLAATTTEKVDLGTSITLAFARNPMTLAVQANDVHALSGGRLVLGLGSQVKAHITRRFSMPWSQPAARMREYVLALRAIWACFEDDAPLDFNGEFYTHTLMTPFFKPEAHGHGTPKVLLAAVGGAMTEVAGEVCDGILLHGFTTERYLREVTMPRLASAQGGSLRPGFEVAGMPFIVTGADDEQMQAARTAVQGQIAFYASTPAYAPVLELHGWHDLGEQLHQMSRTGGWQQMGELITDEVLDAFAVVGNPEQIGPELLRRYGDTMTRVRLYAPYDLDPDIADAIHHDLRGER